MTTLAANLSATALTMRVNAGVDEPADYYEIGSEILRVSATQTTVQEGPGPNRRVDDTLWQIAERGTGPTSPAAHSSGATVTPVWIVTVRA